MNKILTKDEILTFLQKKLLAIDNLSSFCNNHNLNYQILSAIKNGRAFLNNNIILFNCGLKNKLLIFLKSKIPLNIRQIKLPITKPIKKPYNFRPENNPIVARSIIPNFSIRIE